jgi:hypothetical protein
MPVTNGADSSIAADTPNQHPEQPHDSTPSTAPDTQTPLAVSSASTATGAVAADSSSDNTATSVEDAAVQDKTLSSSPPTTPPPSADPVDASPVDDQQLATSSSPDRRSELDEHPVVIADDFLSSVIAVLESLPPRRVKVYELRRDVWVDLGTGFCQGYIENVLRPPKHNVGGLLVTEHCIFASHQRGDTVH